MKKFKLSLVVSVLLILVLSLSACGGNSFSSFYDNDGLNEKRATPTTFTQLDLKGEIVDMGGNLIGFNSEEVDANDANITNQVITVYDLEENKVIGKYSVDKSKYELDVSFDAYLDVDYYVIDSEDLETGIVATTIYNESGVQVYSIDDVGEIKLFKQYFDLMLINDEAYRIGEDGTIKKAFDLNPMSDYTYSLTMKIDDYYYGTKNGAIIVLDEELNLLRIIDEPSYARNFKYFALENGDVFVQYWIEEATDAEDYTFIDGDAKITLVSKIIDVDNGDEDEVDLDYIINNLTPNDAVISSYGTYMSTDFDNTIYNSSIDNFVQTAIKIENQRLLSGATEVCTLSLTNSGKVDGVLEKTIAGQLNQIEVIGENAYILTNSLGQNYLVNEDGDAIGEVVANIRSNGNVYYNNDAVYSAKLKKIYDLKENGYTVSSAVDGGLLLKKTVDSVASYYLLQDGTSEPQLIENFEKSLYNMLYVTKVTGETEVQYKYYTYNGLELYTSNLLYDAYVGTKSATLLVNATTDADTGITTYSYLRVS